MKKIIAGAFVVAVTVVTTGAAYADGEPLPGRRPPCSILRKAQAPGWESICQRPASGTTAPGGILILPV